jgi:alkanesulfonate monooxygenase SsuD/methylene tetrahydromethanopterin reductase-like flavin-dependent oxidoreductase (luciferase family)
LRGPEFGTPTRKLARIHIEQAEWCDKHGFDTVQLPEHHGCEDGYDPSPFILGAAIAARTSKIRIHPSAVLLPLHDPVRVAEDAAVLDNLSDGRLDLTIGLGYLPSEFAMFGVRLEDRAQMIESKLIALRRALAGEHFEYEGRPVHVTPRPVQQPNPPLYVGGGVKAAARRAARLGDGFLPAAPDPELKELYRQACRELGKEPGPILDVLGGPQAIFVSEDPEETWRQVGPHAMYETNYYGKWQKESGAAMPFRPVEDVAGLKALGIYQVVTPDECIALARDLEARNALMVFNATLAGLDEKTSWASLELFASKVLPHITPGRTTQPDTIKAMR